MEQPNREALLRGALRIPAGAERVLVLGESSHWDPNWLFTSTEYFRLRVRKTLDLAIDALERDEHRVYSIECVFFLKLYWDHVPRRRDAVRRLVNEGRLRLTGSAITTPDTVLPDTEAILRDYLVGQEWLRARGMTQEPTTAYLPDNFGNSPALPSMLRALGVRSVAFARLDGAFFPGCDYRPEKEFPLAGSNTERLMRAERTLEFVWRDAAGAELLARFHAFGYGQGDLVAHRGLTRWMGMPLAFPARSEKHVASRIAGYVEQLAPLARTPYLFCPIGFDFVDPIRDLGALIERYNRVRYPTTGVFVVNAGIDDFFALADCHRAKLPVVDLDPNPYWSGFYSARPALKQSCRQLVDDLVELEGLEAVRPPSPDAPAREHADAWFWAAVSNHHDFITGTSPDRVVHAEQEPRLADALRSLEPARTTLRTAAGAPASPPGAVSCVRVQHRIEVRTDRLCVTLDEERGGCIARVVDVRTGATLLDHDSADLASFHDSGGLWRMGQEFRGGAFRAVDRQSAKRVEVEIRESPGVVELVTRARVGGDAIVRTLWVRGDRPHIRVRVEGALRKRRSLVMQFRTPPLQGFASMGVPGGAVDRPHHKLYSPTFWPVNRWATFRPTDGSTPLTLVSPGPASVGFEPEGVVRCVVLRNATRERAFGFLPLLGFPASGHESAPAACDLALAFGDGIEEAVDAADHDPRRTARRRAFAALVETDRPCVRLLALKRASRGEGVIVRLAVPTPDPEATMAVSWAGPPIRAAWLCDARERDRESLPIAAGAVVVPTRDAILSLRLLT